MAVIARITKEQIDVQEADAALRAEGAGAVCLFVGTTRRWTAGRETSELSYEAYEAMALRELEALGAEAVRRWKLEHAGLWHRLGVVAVKEASVVVGASSAHRADAFEACRFMIDTLKQEVPIWKKEVYADGTTEWVEGGG